MSSTRLLSEDTFFQKTGERGKNSILKIKVDLWFYLRKFDTCAKPRLHVLVFKLEQTELFYKIPSGA